MKKALYIIFIIGVLVISGLHVNMFIREYIATTVTEIESEKPKISNSDGSYLLLFNPGQSIAEESVNETKEQVSMLITVEYNLLNAKYFILDDYYTKMDYNFAENQDGVITQVNLYNELNNEKLTLEYDNVGEVYSEPQHSTVDAGEIPKANLISNATKDKKIALSKENAYVEIPEYFEVVKNDYLYVPVDFVQFTNISATGETVKEE